MSNYADLSTVMGSTANGTVVPSAYGDQVRDNLLATATGYYFIVRGATGSQVVPNGSWGHVTLAADFTDQAGASVTSASNYVVLTGLTGTWLIGGWINPSGATVNPLYVGGLGAATTTVPAGTSDLMAYDYLQSTSTHNDQSFVTQHRVTASPWYLSLWMQATGGTVTLDATVLPMLWGVRLRES